MFTKQNTNISIYTTVVKLYDKLFHIPHLLEAASFC